MMKKTALCLMAVMSIISATNAQTKTVTKPVAKKPVAKAPVAKTPVTKSPVTTTIMKNSIDSFSYAVGLNIARSMKDQGINSINLDLLKKAMNDVFNENNCALTDEVANMTLQQKLQEFAQKKSESQKAEGIAYLEANKKRKGVVSLPNGLQYEILTAGNPAGIKPVPVDTVRVHYVGTLIDGTEFDSSVGRGEPINFPLNGVIRGWTEILQHMTIGAKWKVYIPSDLAYGDRGAGGSIPPGAALIFEIELLDVMQAAVK